MNAQDTTQTLVIGTPASAQARVDWGRGRIVGYSVPADDALAFDVVQLWLDDRCVASAVANLSVFDKVLDLAGLGLPSREHAAFELRIPQGALLPGQLGAAPLKLSIRTSRGTSVFEMIVRGAQELLQLVDGAPVDLLYQVRFHGAEAGALHGSVNSLHGMRQRPALMTRVNDEPAEPLAFYESAADGSAHYFSIPLRVDHLSDGRNLINIVGLDGQLLASYPIRLGAQELGDTERRLQALEAEVAFLKRLVLAQNPEAMSARLALLKSEVVAVCSDMLSLQRTNFEREWLASAGKPDRLEGS